MPSSIHLRSKQVYFQLILLVIMTACNSKDSRPQEIIHGFFDTLERNGSDAAIDVLFSTNRWVSDSEHEIENMKTNFKETLHLLGNFHGYEQLELIDVSLNLKHFVYLVKFDRQPLRFTFTLYMPNQEWQVQSFNYDYQIIEELKEASRVGDISH